MIQRSRGFDNSSEEVRREHPFIKKLRKAVVFITIGLIILFFYEAYFG